MLRALSFYAQKHIQYLYNNPHITPSYFPQQQPPTVIIPKFGAWAKRKKAKTG